MTTTTITIATPGWRALPLTVLIFALASVGAGAGGCLAPSATPAAAAAGGGAFPDCGPEGLIDDGEDGNNQIQPTANRGGYWYTFVDKAGSTVSPVAGEQGGTFAMAQGGADGSKFAANVKGTIGTGAVVFGAMGLNFTDPKEKVDAAKYAGIAFYARRGESSTGKVRLKVPDITTDPDGGICSECFNDFGGDLNLTTEWRKYVFPFKKMAQMPGWGAPRKPHVNPAGIYGLQWQVNVPGATYDIWVDDVQFLCQ
jgi:endoglucanase